MPPTEVMLPPPSEAAHVESSGVTAMTIDTARDGPLVISRSFDDRWSASSGPVAANLGVELLVPASGGTVKLAYEGWRLARIAYAISMVGLTVLFGVWCLSRFWKRRSGTQPA